MPQWMYIVVKACDFFWSGCVRDIVNKTIHNLLSTRYTHFSSAHHISRLYFPEKYINRKESRWNPTNQCGGTENRNTFCALTDHPLSVYNNNRSLFSVKPHINLRDFCRQKRWVLWLCLAVDCSVMLPFGSIPSDLLHYTVNKLHESNFVLFCVKCSYSQHLNLVRSLLNTTLA